MRLKRTGKEQGEHEEDKNYMKRIMAALLIACVALMVCSGVALAVTTRICEDFCTGTKRGDHLIGTATDTSIVGRGGNDKISDTATQGHDNDSIFGGGGDDQIDVRDGDHENNIDSVDCGRGKDRVFADANDVIASNCEKVFVG